MKQVCCTLGMKLLSLAKLIRWTLTFWLDKCEVLWASSSYLVALLMRPFNLQDSLTREEYFNFVDLCYWSLQDCLCNFPTIISCGAVISSIFYSLGSHGSPKQVQLISKKSISNVWVLEIPAPKNNNPHLKIFCFQIFYYEQYVEIVWTVVSFHYLSVLFSNSLKDFVVYIQTNYESLYNSDVALEK